MNAPDWMLEGVTDLQRHRINRDYRNQQRKGVLGFCRDLRSLKGDMAEHKAGISAVGQSLDRIAQRLKLIEGGR